MIKNEANKKITHAVSDKAGGSPISCEIGGDLPDKYYPEAKFSLYGGEDSISIDFPSFSGYTPTIDDVTGKVTLNTPQIDVEMYMLNESDLEFGALLKQPLPGNSWIFNLTGWENFTFYKQPDYSALPGATVISAASHPDGVETVSVDIDGINHECPLDMCGGYAVYHKTKRNNQYATGKVLNIPRPKLIGDDGDIHWGEIDIADGSVVVSASKQWLNKAVYPVFVDPTFGYTTAGASSAALSITECVGLIGAGYTYTASTGDTITKFTAYSRTYTAGDMSLTAYTVDGSGDPNTAVNTTGGSLTHPADPAWTDTGAVSYGLSNGVEYCVAFSEGVDGGRIYYDAGAGNQSNRDNTNASFAATWAVGPYNANIYSVYATYTAGGGGGTAGPPTGSLSLLGVGL